MNLSRTATFNLVLAATFIGIGLQREGAVEAQAVPNSANVLPARFLFELALPAASERQQPAAAAKKQSDQANALPAGKGRDLAQKDCSTCHATDVWTTQHHTKDQWSSIVDNMVAKGLDAPDSDLDIINDYLAANFGPVKTAPPAPPADAPPAPK